MPYSFIEISNFITTNRQCSGDILIQISLVSREKFGTRRICLISYAATFLDLLNGHIQRLCWSKHIAHIFCVLIGKETEKNQCLGVAYCRRLLTQVSWRLIRRIITDLSNLWASCFFIESVVLNAFWKVSIHDEMEICMNTLRYTDFTYAVLLWSNIKWLNKCKTQYTLSNIHTPPGIGGIKNDCLSKVYRKDISN